MEVGAEDGLWLSNTWWLEAELGWDGVLIEGDPRNYQQLKRSPRKSRILPFCVTSELTIARVSEGRESGSYSTDAQRSY